MFLLRLHLNYSKSQVLSVAGSMPGQCLRVDFAIAHPYNKKELARFASWLHVGPWSKGNGISLFYFHKPVDRWHYDPHFLLDKESHEMEW